jgi:hypothetical protein
MVIKRVKAIKDLLLDKLDTNLSRIDDLERIVCLLSENSQTSQSKLDVFRRDNLPIIYKIYYFPR